MNYTVIKSRRRTISITVNADGSVTVRAPINASIDKINNFVAEKSGWIEKTKRRINENNADLSDVLAHKSVMLFGEVLPFYTEFKRDLVKIAGSYLTERLFTLAETFNFKYKGIKLRNFKAKWGSLDKNGVISLNLKLIMLKRPLIDYVLLHELCHLSEFNHSKRFYAILNKIEPNAEALRKELRKFGALARIEL